MKSCCLLELVDLIILIKPRDFKCKPATIHNCSNENYGLYVAYSATSLTKNITFVYNNNSSINKVSTSFICCINLISWIVASVFFFFFFEVVAYEIPSQLVTKVKCDEGFYIFSCRFKKQNVIRQDVMLIPIKRMTVTLLVKN